MSVRGRAVVASLPHDIAEREISSALKEIDWPEDVFSIEHLPSDRGPGNILLLEAEFAHHTEVTSGFGQLGVSAQSIGRNTANRMAGYIRRFLDRRIVFDARNAGVHQVEIR